MRRLKYVILAGFVGLGACSQESGPSGVGSAKLGATAPRDAAPGTCWDKKVTPAKVETYIEDILVQPAQISTSGTIQSPPVYKSETRQRILSERQEDFVQIPCLQDLTEEFVASLQRALGARGYYAGPPSGALDGLTLDAITRFQADNGQSRKVLTVETAQMLGLWKIAPAG